MTIKTPPLYKNPDPKGRKSHNFCRGIRTHESQLLSLSAYEHFASQASD